MTIFFKDQNTYQGPATQVDTTALYELGTVAKAEDTTYGALELVYLQAGANDVLGSAVTFGGDYVTALAVANAVGQIGASLAPKSSGEFGWFVVRGNVPVKVLADFADDAKCYLTATAGSFDDAAVVGDDVFAAKSISAIGTPSSGLAVINLNNSFVMDGLAS